VKTKKPDKQAICNKRMQKIEIRVDPDDGLLSSVRVGGVEIGNSVSDITYRHTAGRFPTLTLNLVSDNILLEIPNAEEDMMTSKRVGVWRASSTPE